MPIQVQHRRGSTVQHSTFTGAVGEITVDTDKDTVVVHDGVTVGGFPLAPSSAFSVANAAFGVANNAYTSTNGTAAFAFANGVSTNTTASFGLTNTVYAAVNSVFGVANAAYTSSNADYTTTNSAFGVANAAFGVANNAYTSTNGTAAFAFANGVSTNTTAAFAAANSKVATVSGTAGRVTSSGTTAITLDLATAGPGAGSYSGGISALTIDAYGRLTAVTGSASYLTSITSAQVQTALGYIPGYIGTPINNQTIGYTFVASDAGKTISITTGGVTVPASTMNVGDTVVIYNNSSSSQTITQGGSVTLYQVGTGTTGNRTLAQRGLCSVLCVATNVFVISGGGLS